MDYIQVTEDQRKEMLEVIGVESVDRLFDAIPPEARFTGSLNLPPPASELEVRRDLDELARRNTGAHNAVCFLGGGAYDHFIPAFIDQLILRGEFLTAYTPYQAEASQGSLQAFFEFQTQVARLAGLDIANASLYDGATAVAEAALLAIHHTARRRVLVASTIHPHTLQVLRTYTDDLPCELVMVQAGEDGVVSAERAAAAADGETACIIVQSPNVFGLIEDWEGIFRSVRSKSAGAQPLSIAVFNPIAAGLLRSPGACGADVAVAEGQPLGVPLQMGGPYLGLFAAKRDLVRRMPGRLIGQTVDRSGRRVFCLTLQTREQHIRGEKATSNICTNQGLLALRATMYMTAIGPGGLRDVAERCWHKAHHLAQRIGALPGHALRHGREDGAAAPEFFNEFVVRCPRSARAVVDSCRARGILAGIPLHTNRMGFIGDERDLLVAVTEKRTKQEMDALVAALSEAGKA
jgi:glycine dehydrogenase subunit 1